MSFKESKNLLKVHGSFLDRGEFYGVGTSKSEGETLFVSEASENVLNFEEGSVERLFLNRPRKSSYHSSPGNQVSI